MKPMTDIIHVCCYMCFHQALTEQGASEIGKGMLRAAVAKRVDARPEGVRMVRHGVVARVVCGFDSRVTAAALFSVFKVSL